MSQERSFGWLKAVAIFFAGCAVTFAAMHYWPVASITPVTQQTSKNEWRFQADFKLPKFIEVNGPDQKVILSFYIQKSTNPVWEPYPVTIQNPSNQPYRVTYELFAYDGYTRRLDDTTDTVTIAPKETVLRQLYFSYPFLVDSRTFASFRLIADIEH